MEFNSLQDITKYFKLESSNDLESIKKKLKKEMKSLHPDKDGNDDFETEGDKERFLIIQNALNYLQTNKHLIIRATKNELSTEVKKIEKKIIKHQSEDINKKASELSNRIKESVEMFHKRNFTPKITGLVITTIITGLWAFPSLVKDHPFLSFIYDHNREFSMIWICFLLLTAILWIKVQKAEKTDQSIKQSYKVEVTQNQIFLLFIKWQESNYKNVEHSSDYKITTVKFTGDDLIRFLITRYTELQEYIERESYRFSYDHEIVEEIRKLEKDKYFSKIHNRKMSSPISFLHKYLPTPGEVNLEIAQLISDLITSRLLQKKIIEKISTKGLSDIYKYEH